MRHRLALGVPRPPVEGDLQEPGAAVPAVSVSAEVKAVTFPSGLLRMTG
jgi:hypothetical protein